MLLGSLILFAVFALLRKRLRPQHPWAYLWTGVFQSGLFVALSIVSIGALAYNVVLATAIAYLLRRVWGRSTRRKTVDDPGRRMVLLLPALVLRASGRPVGRDEPAVTKPQPIR